MIIKGDLRCHSHGAEKFVFHLVQWVTLTDTKLYTDSIMHVCLKHKSIVDKKFCVRALPVKYAHLFTRHEVLNSQAFTAVFSHVVACCYLGKRGQKLNTAIQDIPGRSNCGFHFLQLALGVTSLRHPLCTWSLTPNCFRYNYLCKTANVLWNCYFTGPTRTNKEMRIHVPFNNYCTSAC